MRYSQFFAGVKPFKQPDFYFNTNHWEMESYDNKFKYSKISSMLKKGAEQSDRIILKIKHKADIEQIIRRAFGCIKNSKVHLLNVKEVLLVDVDGNVFKIK